MRRTRPLWLSILFVLVLVGASVTAFATGTRPVLGLDLEGGVSVILSAPEGTPTAVMDQALENIRNRIDAFGTAEPILFVSGTNIEVQIPGLARGAIEERAKRQDCLLDADGVSYGCFDQRSEAEAELQAATVEPVVQSVCLSSGDIWGDADTPCFGSRREANTAIDALSVEARDGTFVITGTGLAEDPVFETRGDAEAAISGIQTDVTQTYCVEGRDGTLASDVGSACDPTREEAEALLDGLTVSSLSSEFCVVSSADKQLGCFLTRDAAAARLQETGQERLLQVIGQTARLEQREVLGTLTPTSPDYDSTPATCGTAAERQTDACSFRALRDRDVVFLDRDGTTKYKLGPVLITGDAISRANAVYDTGGQTSVGQGWQITFDLTDRGSAVFGEVTTRLVGRQLAIVVDQQVISAPTVQSAITGGSGVITGSFTENRAKDLATQLNAGALPVNLTT
ncbi:MAG TPA: hypothetical protein VE669_01185, partial [Actinomycetota bacterium]|nr:hypothetical protein [Actinomycetota bacterium]